MSLELSTDDWTKIMQINKNLTKIYRKPPIYQFLELLINEIPMIFIRYHKKKTSTRSSCTVKPMAKTFT
jgi:hypothetical protein